MFTALPETSLYHRSRANGVKHFQSSKFPSTAAKKSPYNVIVAVSSSQDPHFHRSCSRFIGEPKWIY